MIENRKGPRISVQRRNADSPVEGQLGIGVLVALHILLIPRRRWRRGPAMKGFSKSS